MYNIICAVALVFFLNGNGVSSKCQLVTKSGLNISGKCVIESRCLLKNESLNSPSCDISEKICCPDKYILKTKLSLLDYIKMSSKYSEDSLDQALNNERCGELNENKIAYSKETKLGDFPFLALLGYRISDNKVEIKCGGTLITSRFVLTSAHCLDKELEFARFGEHFLDTDEDCESSRNGDKSCALPSLEIEIEKQIPHKKYEKDNLFDIGLIKLKESVPLNNREHINTICLPIAEESKLKKSQKPSRFMIAGWGQTNSSFNSNKLQKSIVTQKSIRACKNSKNHLDIIPNKHNICVANDGLGYCKGDFGGPLFRVAKVHIWGRYVQYGVSSSHLMNCQENGGTSNSSLAAYVNVQHFVEWIQGIILES